MSLICSVSVKRPCMGPFCAGRILYSTALFCWVTDVWVRPHTSLRGQYCRGVASLLWRLGFSIVESSVVFLWPEDLRLHSSYAVSSFQFTFYFHLTLYAHQVMMSLLYLCPCQDNGRLWKSSFTILGNTSQCFPTPMQNNYFGWFNSSKGSMSPLDPLGLHHFCRFFGQKKG